MSDSISRFSLSGSAFSRPKPRAASATPTAASRDSAESSIVDVTGIRSGVSALKAMGTPSPSSRESTDSNSSSHTITRMDNSSSATEFLTSTPSSLDATTKSSAGTSPSKESMASQRDLPQQALNIFFHKEVAEVSSFLDRAKKETVLCNQFIYECQGRLSAIHPTLLARLQLATTSEELKQIVETVPLSYTAEIENLFNSLKEYRFLASLSEDIIAKATSLLSGNFSLNRALYFARGLEHLQKLDHVAQKIHVALQARGENLTKALREMNPQKQNAFFQAGRMGLFASRFLRYSVKAFREKRQALLASYSNRATSAFMALKSYENAAEYEVQELPLHHNTLPPTDSSVAIPRVMATARGAAYGAAYCYKYAGGIQTRPAAHDEEGTLSVAGILRPIYQKTGDLFTAGFHQLLDAKTAFLEGDGTRATMLELQADAVLGVAESQRIRMAVSTPEIGRQSLDGTISLLNKIEVTYQKASGIYEEVFSLDHELKKAVQLQDTEKTALLKQQIVTLLQHGSQLRSQAKKSLHRLLSDPRRVPIPLLRELGY